jgi:hypothetical protein
MKPADHSRELEQVMAYVDGALDAKRAEAVRSHIASCQHCRQVEEDLRGVSERLQLWNVDAAPAGLRAPLTTVETRAQAVSFLGLAVTPRRFLATAAGVALVVLTGTRLVQRRDAAIDQMTTGSTAVSHSAQSPTVVASAAPEEIASKDTLKSEPVARGQVAETVAVTQGPLIVRKARLTIVASDFDSARAELERAVQRVGGFIGQIVAHGARGESRRLDATLRVPTARLDETVAALRRLGQVVAEAQDGEDVTQQSADLDTRLENARVSEKRLRDILAQRTGKLSDVLEVEREIARVRGEIEQMESERRSLDRRVTYATVSVTLTEDRKAEVNLGPVPVSRRLRNAFVEGWTNAMGSGVGALLFLVTVGPTLVLWALILVPAAVLVRRRLFRTG